MTDNVRNPKHYQVLDGMETIDMIASMMTEEMFRGFCLGNILKYRIRAGKKDKLQQDIDKANYFEELFDTKKPLCRNINNNKEIK